MQLEAYSVIIDDEHRVYEFLSEGSRGSIKKVVQFQHLGSHLYNLAFGDWNEPEQKVDDSVRSNNNDRDKVLATVASAVIDFMIYHPHAVLFAQGNIPAKTRLYQIGINSNWGEIKELFAVQGFANGEWQAFEQDKNYEAFALMAKKKT